MLVVKLDGRGTGDVAGMVENNFDSSLRPRNRFAMPNWRPVRRLPQRSTSSWVKSGKSGMSAPLSAAS